MSATLSGPFGKLPLVGILRGYPRAVLPPLMEAYAEAGLSTIEITMNSEGALEMIRENSKRFGADLLIGAGTVCTLDQLKGALDAGAKFIVTPVLDESLVKYCKQHAIPVFPGAFTPTEIYRAWEAGATMVKVFPAGTLGADYIKQVKAPLNQLKLMPTGGIGLHNMDEYIKAGADGFGLGSALFDPQLIEDGNWKRLRTHFGKYAAFKNN